MGIREVVQQLSAGESLLDCAVRGGYKGLMEEAQPREQGRHWEEGFCLFVFK